MISTSVINIPERSSISLSTESFYHEDRIKFLGNKCTGNKDSSRQSLSKINHRDYLINYLGFFLRSHSLFYCSVPKVATRTLLIFMTYLHIRDDLIPLLTNHSTSNTLNPALDLKSINTSYFFNAVYINRMIFHSNKVKIRTGKVHNLLLQNNRSSVFFLHLFD